VLILDDMGFGQLPKLVKRVRLPSVAEELSLSVPSFQSAYGEKIEQDIRLFIDNFYTTVELFCLTKNKLASHNY
jgi:hypothetical protein